MLKYMGTTTTLNPTFVYYQNINNLLSYLSNW